VFIKFFDNEKNGLMKRKDVILMRIFMCFEEKKGCCFDMKKFTSFHELKIYVLIWRNLHVLVSLNVC